MIFEISKFNFLSSTEEEIIYFGNLVDEGDIENSKIDEIFKNIQSKTYYKSDAQTIIKNLILASYNVNSKRTYYQTLSNETLLYLVNFIKIKGSTNFKILDTLFPYVINYRKDENKKVYFFLMNIRVEQFI